MHAMPLLSWSTFKLPQQSLGGNYLLSEFAWSNLNSFTRSGPFACPTVCTRIRCISESFRPVFLLLLFLGLPLRPGRPETIPHEPALRCRLSASNVSPSLPSLPCPRSGLPRYSCCWLSLSLPLAHRQLRLAQLYVTALLEDPLRF